MAVNVIFNWGIVRTRLRRPCIRRVDEQGNLRPTVISTARRDSRRREENPDDYRSPVAIFPGVPYIDAALEYR